MTPRPAATLIVLRPGDGTPQVLMLERPPRGAFGGLWAFPGGSLEPIDGGDLAGRAVVVPDGADDRAWRVAALRETVEEVGLAVTDPQLAEPVDALGEGVFEAVRSRGARLDGRRLRLLSRWITPAGLPTRFDARFYLTRIEHLPALLPREEEVADLRWVTAADGLARARSREWPMARPTLQHLRWLADHSDLEAIWAAAGRARSGRRATKTERDGSEVRLRLPTVSELP